MKDTATISVRIDFKKIFYWIKTIAIIAVLAAIGPLARHFYYQRVQTRANSYVEVGFGAFAADYLEPDRHYFTDSPEGCRLLLSAYGMANFTDRLRWAMESCIYNQVRIGEMHLAAGRLDSLDGDVQSALAHFMQAGNEFKNPLGVLSAVDILRLHKRDTDAIEVLRKGLSDFPKDDQIALMALRVFSAAKLNVEVRRLSFRLMKLVEKMPDVELRSLVAEGLIAGGDPQSGQRLLDSIQSGVAVPVEPGPPIPVAEMGSPPPIAKGGPGLSGPDVPFVVNRHHRSTPAQNPTQ